MSVQTSIKWRDFLKTIEYFADLKFGKYSIINKPGSGRRIELFKDHKDITPCEAWVVHEDTKSKVVWSKDLKKACLHLDVSVKEFTKKAERI